MTRSNHYQVHAVVAVTDSDWISGDIDSLSGGRFATSCRICDDRRNLVGVACDTLECPLRSDTLQCEFDTVELSLVESEESKLINVAVRLDSKKCRSRRQSDRRMAGGSVQSPGQLVRITSSPF